MKRIWIFLWILLLSPAVFGQGTTQNTVVPYGLESQNGNQHTTQFGGPGDYQHWFRGNYLAQAWNSPVEIAGVAFRVNEQPVSQRPYDAVIPRIEIWLSTTSLDSTQLLSFWQLNPKADRVKSKADRVKS
jgi:hypothetical protein